MSKELRDILFIVAVAAVAALVMALPPCDAGDSQSACTIRGESH
jgi:hypothetical protein